jgi:hypothetical protein
MGDANKHSPEQIVNTLRETGGDRRQEDDAVAELGRFVQPVAA